MTYSGAVPMLRHVLLRHRTLAAWVLSLALLMKLLVPAGYMVGGSAGAITIELCSGYGPMKMTMTLPGTEQHQDKDEHQGKEMPCAFSGLATPSLAAVDPLLLALVIAFIVATIFRVATSSAVGAPAHLRPPLRGPPARH
jgi:hypothetical protein